jgi:hypothetical protein
MPAFSSNYIYESHPMKINQYIIKLIRPSSKGSLLTDHCSGAFLTEITRVALLAVVLGISMVLATGCAATNKGVSANLITPVPRNQEISLLESSGSYVPARSPAFSDSLGS